MSRQSLEARAYRVKKVTMEPAGTGSQPLYKLVMPLVYDGEEAEDLVEFMTSVGASAVQAGFSLPGEEDYTTVVGKIRKGGLTMPRKRADHGAVVVDFAVISGETGPLRELAMFTLEAWRAEELVVDVEFKIVQEELDFDGEDGDGAGEE